MGKSEMIYGVDEMIIMVLVVEEKLKLGIMELFLLVLLFTVRQKADPPL